MSDQTQYQPWEKQFDKVMTPFESFIHEETTSGLLLMACTVIALFLANSFLYDDYKHFLHMEVAISIGGWTLSHSLHHWINDGLMALFFMVVGLEIKREIIVGELSDPRAALMPIIAAVGGMLMPALSFYILNPTGPGVDGWGIPMATDIAFAVGVLVLLGDRIPKTVLTFLVALAIVDDLGAVIVIALFYTDQIHVNFLAIAAGAFAVLVAFNRMGIRSPLPYFGVGAIMWFAMLESGVHATLAGVLIALTIPVTPRFDPQRFSTGVRRLMDKFDIACEQGTSSGKRDPYGLMRNTRSRAILQTLENSVHSVESPLQRLEHSMHMPVAFLIIPIFALANAGIPIYLDGLGSTLTNSITLGVMLGLIVGKLLGIAGMCWVAIKLGWGQLPEGMTMHHLVGVGFLGGIGFTMSIFIAELGFAGQEESLLMAKTGVLFASLIAGVAGYLWLRMSPSK